MTISWLDEAIRSADVEKCIAFFDSMPESQRKALAPRALQWISALVGLVSKNSQYLLLVNPGLKTDVDFYNDISAGTVEFVKDLQKEQLPAAGIAVLATCNLPEIKKSSHMGFVDAGNAARVLIARRPNWIDKWCAFVLKEAPAIHWHAIYELETAGLLTAERNESYWLAMVCSINCADDMYENILAKNEKVRDEIWLMLNDPGVMRMLAEPEVMAHESFRKRWNSGTNIFAPNLKVGSRGGTELWLEVLCKLAENGLLDKERLREYSFMALADAAEKESKKSVYNHKSTADFAISLNKRLTEANPETFAGRFAALIGSRHKDVCTYTLRTLLSLPSGAISAEDICSGITGAFLNKSKEPAEAALDLLARLGTESPSERRIIGPALFAAFTHTSKEIHKRALALIETTGVLEEETLLDVFHARLDMLAGMERAGAAKLLAKYRGADAETVSPGAPHVVLASGDDLMMKAESLDDGFKRLAHIDALVRAVHRKEFVDAPVDLDGLHFPRLDPEKLVEPITNVDDLVYMFLKVWSGNSTAMELESVIDGVSRLCNERPPDFGEKTEVLRQKAAGVEQQNFSFGWHFCLAHLATSWISDADSTPGAVKAQAVQGGSYFARRCFAVAKRSSARQSAPMLCAPTHAGGWIDPLVLVTRLQQYYWSKIQPDPADVVQAFLRIAPDTRAEALAAAADLKGEVADAFRYALGTDKFGPIVTSEYWVAAFRARDPRGTNNELLKLLPKCGPDGPQAATYELDMSEVVIFAADRYASISGGLPQFLRVASNDPTFPGAQLPRGRLQTTADVQARMASSGKYQLYPTVILHDNSNGWFLSGSLSYMWLQNRESLLALYAKRILQSIDSVGSYWHGDFELLFDPDISMNGNGKYLLCLAMSSKNNDFARLALDALIAAVAQCRITAAGFGEAMAAFLPTGAITSVRWTRGLREMSSISALHTLFTWRAVSSLLQHCAITPTQQIPFLELLVEVRCAHAIKVDDSLRLTLSNIGSTGKGAKLAKALLNGGGADSRLELSAALESLGSRIQRAERWQRWSKAWQKQPIAT